MRLIDADKLPYVNKVILVDDVDGDITITVAKERTSYVNGETPTVRAIPIDWIVKRINYYSDLILAYPNEKEILYSQTELISLLEDWENENEMR